MAGISGTLAAAIRDLLKRRPAMTLNSFSRQSGVPYPTLKRIIDGEGEPAAKTVIALAPHLLKGEELSEILKKIGLENSAHPTMGRKILESQETPFLRDTVDLQIVGLLCRKDGVSKVEIQKEFGSSGIARLNSFVSREIAKIEGNVFRIVEESLYVAGRTETFEKISLSLELMKSQSAENQAYIQSIFAVSEEGFKELIQIYKRFRNESDAVFKKHPGNIVGVKSAVLAKILPDWEDAQ